MKKTPRGPESITKPTLSGVNNNRRTTEVARDRDSPAPPLEVVPNVPPRNPRSPDRSCVSVDRNDTTRGASGLGATNVRRRRAFALVTRLFGGEVLTPYFKWQGEWRERASFHDPHLKEIEIRPPSRPRPTHRPPNHPPPRRLQPRSPPPPPSHGPPSRPPPSRPHRRLERLSRRVRPPGGRTPGRRRPRRDSRLAPSAGLRCPGSGRRRLDGAHR